MNRDDAVAELACSTNLARALMQAFDEVRRRLAFVALRYGRARASAFVADDGGGGPDAPHEPMPVGCLAKLLTATLAQRLFAQRDLALDARVVDLLDLGDIRAAFAGMTLRHLLEHTHGLDDSSLDRAPLREGFIAVDELAESVSAVRPLARPGAVYSYGNVGAWLTAALLERATARPYAALLTDELLAPLGMTIDGADARGGERHSICPASGIGLSLAVGDWLRFLEHTAADRRWSGETDGAVAITALPGWNPLERGIRLGWKSHGHGWFGHQSVWPGSSAFVRMNPSRAIALALISRDHAASVVAARMFGAALPELFDVRMPPPLPRGVVVDSERYVGRYAAAALRAEILFRGEALELRVHDRARGLTQSAALVPAAAHTFFTRSPMIESLPYVQLVAAGGAEYLWNGRFVLPRL